MTDLKKKKKNKKNLFKSRTYQKKVFRNKGVFYARTLDIIYFVEMNIRNNKKHI